MPTVAEMRSADFQRIAHIMVVEGIPYSFTDDRSGELLGNGINSWWGETELVMSSENVGGRTMLAGLELPRGLSQSRDPKTGALQSRPIQIKIQDNADGRSDNIVAGLLGENSKPYDTLGQTVPAGTTNLSNSLIAWGVGATLNPRDRYIGIEKIGALGERHEFPVIPDERIGYQHAVFPNIPEPFGLPLVKVSDDPIVWEGRRVAIYRLHRDPDVAEGDITAWPTWDEQHAAGNLVWWGKLRGEARVNGQQEWTLQCVGAKSWTSGKLGVNTSEQSFPATANVNLRDSERYCSVVFVARGNASGTGGTAQAFQGSVFDQQLTSGSTKEELRDEIDAIIQGQFDGSDTANVNLSADHFELWQEGIAVDQNPRVGLNDNYQFYIQKDDESGAVEMRWGEMRVVLHEKVWATLGFDVRAQGASHPMTSNYEAQFTELEVGSQYLDTWGEYETVPNTEYWEAIFTTIKHGEDQSTGAALHWDNDGLEKRFAPLHDAQSTFYLDNFAGQTVYLPSSNPYVEPQTTLLPFPGAQVEGTDTDGARLALFYGKRHPTSNNPTPDELEEDAEDYFAVAQVSFVTTATPGEILPTSQGVPAVHIDQWLDARAFGFDVRPHDRRWIGAASGPAQIRMVFLGGWPSNAVAGNQPEYANAVLTQILLSSGTSTGIAAFGLDEGENSPNATADYDEGGDWEIADYGLGVPSSMVADPTDIRAAFDDVPGGADGPLNRVRYGFIGPVKAQDVLDGILRTRRLGWSLHGRRYGVQRLGPKTQDDVDIVINESDLHGKVDDPRTVIPKIEPGRLGAFDDVALEYRWNPFESGGLQQTLEVGARDEGARYRAGDIKIDLHDRGLLPYRWYSDMTPITGAEPWHQDFRTLWQYETAEYFNQRHHIVTLEVGPHIALDCRPGTVVRLTNPWLVTSDGTYGVVNGVGTIEESVQHPRRGSATLKILLFGGSFANLTHFAPIVRVTGWTGAVFDVEADAFAHGNTGRHDATGCVAPSWVDGSTDMAFDLVERLGHRYTVTDVGNCVSIDTAANTITMSANIPSGVLRDTDKWLIPRTYDNQPANGWARNTYGWVCSDDLHHSAANADGAPFV